MAIRRIPNDTETFMYHNENPKNNRAGDCVVRALAAATGDSWETVLTDLTEIALKIKMMPNDKKTYAKYLEVKGWEKQKQPKKLDGTKYTGDEFVKLVNDTVIAHIGGHHIVCIKDHKVLDTWDSTDGCVGNYWIKRG